MDTSNPAPLLLLGGGVLMIIGSLLDWGPRTSGLNLDIFGLLGIITLLTGAFLGFLGANKAFNLGVGLPDNVAGFSLDQIAFADALVMLMATLGAMTADFDAKTGLVLAVLGSALAFGGAVFNLRSDASASAGATTI